MIRHFMDGNTFVVQADNVKDLEAAHALPRGGVNANHFRVHDATSDVKQFTFWGANKSQIDKALNDGWPEGVDRVQRMAELLRGQLEKPKSFKRRQKWMEDGDEPSWEREQAGRSEIWRTSRRETMRGPTTVELLGTWGGLAHIRADQLQWDGVVLCVLIDLLEEAGYRVGASVNNVSEYTNWGYGVNSYRSLMQVTIKEPHMPLDIASVVPAISFPGVYRYHGLSLKTLAPFDVGSGFGATRELDWLQNCSAIGNKAIRLHHAYSEEAAKLEINRVLEMFKDTSAVSTYIP